MFVRAARGGVSLAPRLVPRSDPRESLGRPHAKPCDTDRPARRVSSAVHELSEARGQDSVLGALIDYLWCVRTGPYDRPWPEPDNMGRPESFSEL